MQLYTYNRCEDIIKPSPRSPRAHVPLHRLVLLYWCRLAVDGDLVGVVHGAHAAGDTCHAGAQEHCNEHSKCALLA